VLFGRVEPGVKTLVVRFADSSSEVISTTGGWFLYEVPRPHQFWHHEPLRLDGLDAAGRVVGSQIDPFYLHQPKQPKLERPLAAHRVLARVPLHWKGVVLELQVAKGNQGHPCVRVLNPANLFQTKGWACGAAVGRTASFGPVPNQKLPPVQFAQHAFGGPGGYAYVRGWVGPQIASLEIRFQDSSVQRIPLHERFFAWVVPSDHWRLGTRPSYAIARDASGKAVWRRFLYPAAPCSYPVADTRCATITVHNG
jgi:hypothetical protein